MSRFSQNIPSLKAEEVRSLQESLRDDASRRKSFVPETPLLIFIDGAQCGILNPIEQKKFSGEVIDGNRWIEVYARTKKGNLLLATHLYHHHEVLEKGQLRYSTLLEGGQKITFTIKAGSDKGRATIDISYHETNVIRCLSLSWRRLKNALSEFISRRSLLMGPALVFLRAIRTRRIAYPLALACLLIALAIPMQQLLYQKSEEIPEVKYPYNPVLVADSTLKESSINNTSPSLSNESTLPGDNDVKTSSDKPKRPPVFNKPDSKSRPPSIKGPPTPVLPPPDVNSQPVQHGGCAYK